MPFSYTEIQLGDASPKDLNLIDIAIDREEQFECTEDWTSQLSINLQHCVKVKKSFPSKSVHHVLSLSGLSGDATAISDTPSVKWQSRKLRTKRHLKYPPRNKPSDGHETIEREKKIKKERQMSKKDVEIIQYSRKRYKARASEGLQASIEMNKLVGRDILDTDTEAPGKEDKITNGSILDLPSDGLSESHSEQNMVSSSSECVENSSPSHCTYLVTSSTPPIGKIKAETGVYQVKDKIGISAENVIGCADVTLREEEAVDESIASKTCDQQPEHDCDEMPHSIQSDGYDVIEEASTHGGPTNCSDDNGPSPGCNNDQVEPIPDQLIMDTQVSTSSESEGRQRIQTERDDKEVFISRTSAITDESTPPLSEKKASKSKRKRETVFQLEDNGFIRSPCERLRPRARGEDIPSRTAENKYPVETPTLKKKLRKASDNEKEQRKGRYRCELEGCTMSFQTKAELLLHKGNKCPIEGCRKKFSSHKYAVQHQRVHDDDRPLKCTWDGCKMSFKWAWARTEHLRVHTGERPYACKVKGCGLTFRFVSDFSRHRRKTGHYVGPT